mgnify:CR=1 FL=1
MFNDNVDNFSLSDTDERKPFYLSKDEIDLIKLIRKQNSLGTVYYWVSVHCQDKESNYY